MRTILEIIGTAVVVGLAGGAVGYLVRKNVAEGKIATAEEQAIRIVQDAEQTGEAKRKEIMMEAKEEIHRLRSEMERENKDRRNDLQRQERRLLQKEENLDRKIESFERKEEKLASKEQRQNAAQEKADAMLEKRQVELERISGLTSDEAKQELLQSLEEEVKHESAMMVKDLEQQAKDEADRKAREIISLAIQRCAADHVAETTVSVVGLPNDEMKGRIIGREGRNIRTLETLTGIDLIIDDTPEAVIISGFDPVRREVARIALEKLINDAPFVLVLVFLVIGFTLLIKGADLFVEGSSSVAKRLHVPSIIIGLTIVALGTSLPELVTSVAAARKGNAGIAIGNIVGSNIFNILFVIGTTALICTVPFESKFIIDTIIAVVVGAILWIGTYKHKELRRPCGIFMLLCYVAYFVYLCMM